MNEATKFLEDVAGFTEKELAQKFVIEETESAWQIKAIGYLEGKTFGIIIRGITERGGGYRKDESTKFAIFTLPKTMSQMPSKEVTTILEEGEYALNKSLKGKLGQLVPCLQDAEGMVIDGFHRLKVNPKAWTVKLDHVKTPVDRAMARMTVNFCRRHYSSEEMKNDIGLLIGSGYTIQQIVDITGISERTIYRYLPEHLKDEIKSKAISEGKVESRVEKVTAVTSPIKTQETFVPTPAFKSIQEETLKELIECANCHMAFHISRATLIDNKNYCPKCAERMKPQPKPKLAPTPFKPKETGEQRKAVMQPQHSQMERAILVRLNGLGKKVQIDTEFCLQSTKPDFYFPNLNLAVYLDGEEVHIGREDKDEQLRELLVKRHSVKVVSISYKTFTKEEVERVLNAILENIEP